MAGAIVVPIRRLGLVLLGATIAFPSIAAPAAVGMAAVQMTDVPIGPRQWRITLIQSQTTDVEAAEAMLVPRAQALCGDEPVRLGHYVFDFREMVPPAPGKPAKPPVMRLVQDVACGMVPPAVPAGPAVYRSDAEAASLGLALARQYLKARYGGDVSTALALVAPDADIANAIRVQMMRKDANLGAPVGRPRFKVTIDRDPSNAPGPGLYVSVDFALAFAKAPAVCGYIVLREPPGGHLAVTREDQGAILATAAAKMSATTLVAVRDRLGCNVPQNELP